MNAGETIQAAIDKLETLSQHASTAVMFLPVKDDPVEYDLGTTLYRTIDAQLAILRLGLSMTTPFAGMTISDDTIENELNLARAILGDQT